MLKCAKKYSQILLTGLLVPAAMAFGAGNGDGKNRTTEQFEPGKDSYRATFELNVPRRFATRFLKDARSLELRVSPARASEFNVSRFYDSRFIHRVVVEETNGDVVLSFQLKNAPVAWLVTHQESPWRLVVDIWRTEPFERRSLEQEWLWQDDAAGKNADGGAHRTDSQQTSRAVRPVEIDLPPEEPAIKIGSSLKQESGIKGTNSENQTIADSNPSRLEPVYAVGAETLAQLERQAGSDVGSAREFDSLEKLATQLYRAGKNQQAAVVFRRLVALNSRRFQDSPRLLWMAGETAFSEGKADLANDYLQSLAAHFPAHEASALGKFRIADLRRMREGGPTAQDLAGVYSEIASDEKAPWAARIGSALRVLEPVVASRPETARGFQAQLQSCLNGQFVSEFIRQSCAYIQTKYAVSQLDVVSPDAALQRFRSQYGKDPRGAVLEAELSNRVKFVLDELIRKKDFPALAEFEKSARAGLLDFTLREPELLMARVEGWLSVGDAKRALGLLQIFTAATADETKRNEAFALMAQLHAKLGSEEKAETALRKLFASTVRVSTGLTDRATAAVREAARPPVSSKTAQNLLIDELKFGRYVERELSMLVTLANASRGREDSDKVFDLLLTSTPRNDDDARRIETALLGYGDDLKNNGRLAKAGDVYMAVANLAQTTKKAEASYKAGVVYARAGMVEKAKTAWQLSAADVSDKKFSSLANERLERIR